MKLNFAMMLPAGVERKAVVWSRTLAEWHDTYFTLGPSVHSHVTVFWGEYSDSNIRLLQDRIHRVVRRQRPIACTVTRVESHQGYVGVEIERTGQIQRLHMAAVRELSSLRIPKEDDPALNMVLSPAQLENLQRYGYPDAMELYNPHMTLTRCKDESQGEEAAEDVQWSTNEFRVTSFGLYESGEHGTCTRLLQEFDIVV